MKGMRNRDERTRVLLYAAAWHGAVFTRTDKMPSLNKVLGVAEPEQSPEEMRAAIVSLNEQLGGDVVYAGEGRS